METTPKQSKSSEQPTTIRVSKFAIIGITLALFNFILYTIIARICNTNDYLWLISFFSTGVTAILAYILHSRITWKERMPTKTGVINFFI